MSTEVSRPKPLEGLRVLEGVVPEDRVVAFVGSLVDRTFSTSRR